jgi:16S rRNA processing protein RimM
MAGQRITLAAITGAHGITGEVKLKCFTDDLSRFTTLDAKGRTLTLKSVRVQPNGVVARFAEITDRNAAEALRGTQLTVDRAALPMPDADEVYHTDLIGLRVATPDGASVGRVVDVVNYGAGDLIEIEREAGKRFLAPYRDVAVLAVDIAAGTLTLDPAFAAED